MKTKTVYQTSNGIYVGETVAHESPLEPGVFHIPAGCVETPPPTLTSDLFARWNGSNWEVENIQKPEPEPEPTPEEIAQREKERAIAEARVFLQQTDWIVVKIAEASMLGQDAIQLKLKYEADLLMRVNARQTINELEAEV